MPITIRQAISQVSPKPILEETEESFFLYRHIRLDNNQVFYVGIGKKGKRRNGIGQEYARAFERRRKQFWTNVVNKAGYRIEIMLESDSHQFIKEKEKEFIKLYGRRDLNTGTLVNFTDGGDGVEHRIQTPETRERISKSHMDKKYTEERKMLCIRKTKEVSEETRQKMAAAQRTRQERIRNEKC